MSDKKALISDSDSESDAFEFKINEEYAEKYTNWRKKEEYQRLKDKYGESVLSEASGISGSGSDSSDDSDQDEQNALLCGDIFDQQFIRVYKALKSKDPAIYDPSVKFISDEPQQPATLVEKKPKENTKMTLMDYQIKLVTERKGETEEDESGIAPRKGYYEELSDIKKKLQTAVDSDDDDDQLFKPKERVLEASKANHSSKEFDDLGEPEDETDRFMRQFIIEKPFLKDIKKDFDSHANAPVTVPGLAESSEDEDLEPVSTETCAKYRFEEEGGTQIKTFPRNLNSARDLVSREEKAAKRKEVRERKKQEKAEELKRLTDLRKQELQERLAKLQETSGNKQFLITTGDNFEFESLVDDDQFDPEKHDEKMKKLFDKEYYDVGTDSQKPNFEFIEGIDDDSDSGDDEEGNADDEDGDLQESGDEAEEEEEVEVGLKKLSRRQKKRRRRKEKDIDIDKLPDYDDVVGGLPVRFKYCKVEPNDFGLSTEEIILADEKDLNRWVSLKKAVSFRDEHEEKKEKRRFEWKRNNLRQKQRVLKSLFSESPVETDKKSTKKRRKRKGKSEAEQQESDMIPKKEEKKELPVERQGRKKRKRKPIKGVDKGRLQAYGFSNSDIKRKKLL